MAENNVFIPSKGNGWEDLRAYLTIEVYTLDSSKIFDRMKEIFGTDVLNKLTSEAPSKLTDIFSSFKDVIGDIEETVKTAQFDVKLLPKGTTPTFTINTFVPNSYTLNLKASWDTIDLFGKTDAMAKGATSAVGLLSGTASKFLDSGYTAIKNHLQYYATTGISPAQVKIFKPEFLDRELEFTFIPESVQEVKDIVNTIKILKQCMIPQSSDGEIFTFPALFNIKVNWNDRKGVVSTDDNFLKSIFFDYEEMGLSSFEASSSGGDALDLRPHADGSLPEYKLSMSFTSVRRNYDPNKSVLSRIEEILK